MDENQRISMGRYGGACCERRFGEHTQTHTHTLANTHTHRCKYLPPSTHNASWIFCVSSLSSCCLGLRCVSLCGIAHRTIARWLRLQQQLETGDKNLADNNDTLFASACHYKNGHWFYRKRFGGCKCQPRKRGSKVNDIFAKDESGFWDRRASGWEMWGHKYQPFLDTAAFLLCHSLSHTRQTNPLPYQPHLSQHRLNFPLQLLIKLFRTTTRGLFFKELHPPPNVVWGVLSRSDPLNDHRKIRRRRQ